MTRLLAVVALLLLATPLLFAEPLNVATIRAVILDIENTNTHECFLLLTTGIDPFCAAIPEIGNAQCETLNIGDCIEIHGQIVDGLPPSNLCPRMQISGITWALAAGSSCE